MFKTRTKYFNEETIFVFEQTLSTFYVSVAALFVKHLFRADLPKSEYLNP